MFSYIKLNNYSNQFHYYLWQHELLHYHLRSSISSEKYFCQKLSQRISSFEIKQWFEKKTFIMIRISDKRSTVHTSLISATRWTEVIDENSGNNLSVSERRTFDAVCLFPNVWRSVGDATVIRRPELSTSLRVSIFLWVSLV